MEKIDKEKRAIEELFLAEKIFPNLKNLNSGFDVKVIRYFNESDFEIVLNRVEKYGLYIYGIEPWLNGEYYDVDTYESTGKKANDPLWYRSSFNKFRKEQEGLMYAASYGLPDTVYQDFLKEKGR